MQNILFVILILTFGCTTNTKQNDKINSIDKQSEKKQYFDYDKLIHYQTNFNEDKIGELFDNQSKSAMDSIKLGVIIDDIPSSLQDTTFISKLELIGYRKKQVDKAKFGNVNELFREKQHNQIMATSCINIYRDILIFKRKRMTIGVSKICFDCMANHIVGTTLNTDGFGQSSDYNKLHAILYK